ncbi:hypothetical protein KSK55_04520 [Methanospirillum purgamenti]|uniref:Uncharacterized protein n=1 Tax=Methanospirillum hungatei TaxID=2203 RepID=A0A8F5ZFM2_METHU|nr:hypothetical protein [Methanospirillum hungatei]QXO95665.1 hypothetical protein KSK55_04520 [Methanospirillum hungatei]
MIATECNPDTYLVHKVFGAWRKKCNHQGNKGKVINFVVNNPGTIGMIDEDPDSNQPGILSSVNIIEGCGDLTLMEMKNGSYIIQISPRLEDWFYKRAKANKMDPSEFGLPRDPNSLHSIPHYEEKNGFQKFIHSLVQKDHEMRTLKKWITDNI